MRKEIFVVVSEDADFPAFSFEGVVSSLEEARDIAMTVAGTFGSSYEHWTPGKIRCSVGYYDVLERIGNKAGDAYWNVCIIRILIS